MVLWRNLGASLGTLGVSWAVMAHLGCFWGVPWVCFRARGRLGGVLGPYWGDLGTSWAKLKAGSRPWDAIEIYEKPAPRGAATDKK